MLLLAFAFLAGIVTILSPCILPVLPSLLAAGALKGKARPFGIVAGFTVSFTLFTLALSWLVEQFNISPQWLQWTAVVILALFGLVLIFPRLSDAFEKWTSRFSSIEVETSNGFWGGFLLGSALGLIWTPCAGPLLATIIVLAVTRQVSSEVFFLTLAYAIGAAIPMLAIIYGGKKLTLAFKAYTQTIRKVFGYLMLLSAIAIFFELPVYIQQFSARFVPPIEVENHPLVIEELNRLRPSTESGKHKIIATGWINSPPLKLEDLKGKVVLIDFWTYSCINCIRTFPYITKWWETYKDKDFVLIGVHSPEFQFEKDYDNVKRAAEKFQLTYPIALDNNFETWRSFNNLYWPAHYLIDKEGNIIYTHFGEGKYAETENEIRKALGLNVIQIKEEEKTQEKITHETYLGYERGSSYNISVIPNILKKYDGKAPSLNQVSLKGEWLVDKEKIVAGKEASLLLNFQAANVYLVLQGSGDLEVFIDGKKVNTVKLDMARKYDIVKVPYGTYQLELKFPEKTEAFAFTFGGESG